jgi:gamma-glutamyltranspeptidase / glutathione hydrolase
MLVRDGKVLMAFGCPGGDAQCQGMLQVAMNVVDFGMNAQQAIDYPRVISASFPDSFFPHHAAPGLLHGEGRYGADTAAALEDLGHHVQSVPDVWRGASSVCVARRLEGGAFEGGADPRRESAAAGW